MTDRQTRQTDMLRQIFSELTTGFVQKSNCRFPGHNCFFFQTFQGILFILMWTKTLQNWLLNTDIYSTMYSSILNTERDSNFWTSNFRCFASWKKINKCMGNQQCNEHLYIFQGFSRLFHTYDHFNTFQGLEMIDWARLNVPPNTL